MLLDITDITLPQSTFYTWLIILIVVLLFSINYFAKLYKKKYEEKMVKDKEELNKAIAEFKIKENELGKITAETRQKATEWGMIELEKFKQTELEALRKILNDNAIHAASNLLTQWIEENKGTIRKDAANRSVRNVLGKVTEHLIPFSDAMKDFNPKDVRFIGSPIDLIVFDGISDKKSMVSIHIIEVKTGTSTLSPRQKAIKDAIENHRVYWLPLSIRDFGDDVNNALKEDSIS